MSAAGRVRRCRQPAGRFARICSGGCRGALAVIVVAVPLVLASPQVSSAGAPEPTAGSAPTTLPVLPEGAGRIVQAPDSGRPAEDPGERGGWMQILVFALILAAVGTVGFLAWRDSSKRRRAR